MTDQNDGRDGVYGFVSDQPGGMTMGEAGQLQDEILQIMNTNDVGAKINTAAQLMTSGRYHECIQAYEMIKAQHPEQAATAESQIGAAEFFLGDYQSAIEHYEIAKALGADPNMMDMNIMEAQQKLGDGATMAMPPVNTGAPQQQSYQPPQQAGLQSHPPQQTQMVTGGNKLENDDVIKLVVSFFLPGVGHMMLGQTVKGIAVFVFFWATCAGGGLWYVVVLLDMYLCIMASKERKLDDWELFPNHQKLLK